MGIPASVGWPGSKRRLSALAGAGLAAAAALWLADFGKVAKEGLVAAVIVLA